MELKNKIINTYFVWMKSERKLKVICQTGVSIYSH